LTIGAGVYQCELGISSELGVNVRALGAPENATIYYITER